MTSERMHASIRHMDIGPTCSLLMKAVSSFEPASAHPLTSTSGRQRPCCRQRVPRALMQARRVAGAWAQGRAASPAGSTASSARSMMNARLSTNMVRSRTAVGSMLSVCSRSRFLGSSGVSSSPNGSRPAAAGLAPAAKPCGPAASKRSCPFSRSGCNSSTWSVPASSALTPRSSMLVRALAD